MSSTIESTADPSLSNELNGNAKKNQDEIEKKKIESKQKFNLVLNLTIVEIRD